MTGLLVACPVIGPPADDVLASWDHRPHLIVVNGCFDAWQAAATEHRLDIISSGDNAGVARSWNLAFLHAQQAAVRYVALVSQHLVLDGGTSRLARLVDQHADHRGLLTDFAWRCIVLSVDVWRTVGPFDECFWPGYFEDSDYLRRLDLAGIHTAGDPIPKIGRELCDAARDDVAVTLRSGLINPAWYRRNRDLYVAKWGGPPGHERYAGAWGRPPAARLAGGTR